MSRATTGAVVAVDVEDGVIGLLEDHPKHDIAVPASLLTESSLRSTVTEDDLSPVVVSSHSAESHHVRALADLEHTDPATNLNNATKPGSTTQSDLEQAMGGQDLSSGAVGYVPPHRTDTDPPPSMVECSDISLSISPPQSICLCQAPTRIPRPRNAFILFRQHHHATVVQQNPGKPNPEISKIIGQMWKNSSDEIKAVWQSHADEEKRQHLQRYPQYRYRPRRNTKKNTTPTAPSTTLDLIPTSIELVMCPNCGGRTGALPVIQKPTPMTRRGKVNTQATRQAAVSASSTKKVQSLDESSPRISGGSQGAMGVDQAGVEALLQLGLDINDDMESRSPPKRRKIITTALSTSIPHNLYTPQFDNGSDPNIDPYLRHSSFDHESSTHPMVQDGSLACFGPHNSGDVFSVRAMPILKKIHAINRICPPLSPLTISPFTTPAVTRMPIVIVEGDDVDVVTGLYRALFQEVEKNEAIYGIDVPDDFTVLSEAYLEGLLNSSGLDRDKDTDDADAARYLNHVASWRRRSTDIRKIVSAGRAPRLVLINRYILSRSDAAALRLSTEGLLPLEHWQWCATVWRSCVGADMTIYVQTLPENTDLGDPIESKDDGRVLFVRQSTGSKIWDTKIIRRLSFGVAEIVRSLKQFGG